jgi:hypothetical protein
MEKTLPKKVHCLSFTEPIAVDAVLSWKFRVQPLGCDFATQAKASTLNCTSTG